MAEQKQAAARRRHAAEVIETALATAPVLSDEARRAALRELGALEFPVSDNLRLSGITSAGPLHEVTEPESVMVNARELLGIGQDDHVIRVSDEDGDCLSGDGIMPGDILVFSPGEPRAGDIVLAAGTDSTGGWFSAAKHYHRKGQKVELRPSNPERPMITARLGGFEVLGVLSRHFRMNVRTR